MKILTYDDITITPLRFTDNPGALAKIACDMTMQTQPDVNNNVSIPKGLLKFILTAEHTSVLEHCSISLNVKGVSRSLLAQLSRHRHASLTSQSQHYQDYSDAPVVISKAAKESGWYNGVFESEFIEYKLLLQAGCAKEEARQVLPNAAAVNLLWTVNARGLLTFLRPRLCWRNVEEMRIFAKKVWSASMLWWPELFVNVGPPCMLGKCNQGVMSEGCPHITEGGFKHDDN